MNKKNPSTFQSHIYCLASGWFLPFTVLQSRVPQIHLHTEFQITMHLIKTSNIQTLFIRELYVSKYSPVVVAAPPLVTQPQKTKQNKKVFSKITLASFVCFKYCMSHSNTKRFILYRNYIYREDEGGGKAERDTRRREIS